jgi:molybdopterin-guanine dinucleotide biosynthesis protein A
MGKPKAWLDFGGEPLLARVVRALSEVTSPIVVVAAPDQDLPPLPPGVDIVRDRIADRGPLEGIRAALGALAALPSPPRAAFVSSTDVPFLSPALIRRLAALQGEHRIVVPRTEGRYHPLGAIYALDVLDDVQALLAQDRLRPFFLFERVPTLIADEALLLEDPALRAADPELRSFRNVNTPDEYARALQDAESREE